MCVKAGGHSPLGHADDHVVVDLSHMNFVQVDTKNKVSKNIHPQVTGSLFSSQTETFCA